MKKILILPCLALVVTCFVWISVVNDTYKHDPLDSGKNNDVFYSEQAESSPHCKSSSGQMVEKTNSAKAERTPIDLGLPSGTLWAAGNIGAELPWETELYFAWGETTGYTAEQVARDERKFDFASYKAKKNKGNIPPEYDAAYANLGGSWEMPSADYYQELLDNCIYTFQPNYGGSGKTCAVFKSIINGNVLVIPCTGYYKGTSLSSSSSVCCWENSYRSSDKAKRVYGTDSSFTATSTSNRYYGLNVRAIIPGPKSPCRKIGKENGYKFIDLGLPSGLKWATCNVGAKLPWETGLYFAWGETTGYTSEQVKEGMKEFSEVEYKRSPAASISANLRTKQDAAHVHMGEKWRMPTNDEFGELIVNCNAEWKGNYNGTEVSGMLFTSKTNGNSIFFPAAGRCINSLILGVNSWGGYWSASDCGSGLAMKLYFQSDFFLRQYYLRCCGFPVRAVCEI